MTPEEAQKLAHLAVAAKASAEAAIATAAAQKDMEAAAKDAADPGACKLHVDGAFESELYGHAVVSGLLQSEAEAIRDAGKKPTGQG